MVRTYTRIILAMYCILSLVTQSAEAKRCSACNGLLRPLSDLRENSMMQRIPQWQLERTSIHKIKRTFTFNDIWNSGIFANTIASVAEAYNHHPDLYIAGNTITCELYTHSSGRLSKTDFIMAQKIDALYSSFIITPVTNQCPVLEIDTTFLSADEITATLNTMNNWSYTQESATLTKVYTLSSFMQSIDSLNTLLPLLACYDGIAQVYIYYNTLHVTLSYNNQSLRMHEFQMAEYIDSALE